MLAVIILFVALANCIHFTPELGHEMSHRSFEAYQQFFNKTYATALSRRAAYTNYIASVRRVALKNKGQTTTTYGLTKFADMSPKEFKDTILMKTLHVNYTPQAPVNPAAIPAKAVDWVAKGMTTPVKNQLQCGSCWTFSATETIESANLIKGKITRNTWLAPQEIVDCDTEGSGCGGGWPSQAMEFIIAQGGQDTESSYPYTGQDGTCASSSGTIGAKISSVVSVAQNEQTMYDLLSAKMPLSICADAEPWQDYSGGILTANQCTTNIDHAIQLTGYSPSQGGYWIVRNSWGANWGEQGFIYLQYGQDTCGITSYVAYANV
jgi:C1A family cysteine protease